MMPTRPKLERCKRAGWVRVWEQQPVYGPGCVRRQGKRRRMGMDEWNAL